jgi:N-acetylmuramoyl-L-alanine amidase
VVTRRVFVLTAVCFLAAVLGFAIPALTSGHAPGTARGRPGSASRPGGPVAGVPVDPALFQAGSCRLFAPTSGNRHQTVFLDAGHGGVDPGAVGKTKAGRTVYEDDLALRVELDALALLRSDGFTVVVSRTADSLVGRLGSQDFSGGVLTPQGVHDDVAARDRCADLAHAAVLVGIYFNAGGSPQNAGCITAYDRARTFWRENLRLARLVQSDVLSALNSHAWGVPNDGVKPDVGLGAPALDDPAQDYGHLLLLGPAEAGWFPTPSDMPGALIESLFVTDPFEASIGVSATGQQAIAGGIALAVEQYLHPGTVNRASPKHVG